MASVNLSPGVPLMPLYFTSGPRPCNWSTVCEPGARRRLPRQLLAQVFGKLFHALELLEDVFRQETSLYGVHVGGDRGAELGEFLGILLKLNVSFCGTSWRRRATLAANAPLPAGPC